MANASGSQRIRELKLLIGGLESPTLRESYPCQNLPCGVPKGAIVELLGPAKTEWLLQFLRENESLRIFWAEREQSVLPTAIHQRGVDLQRITFGILGKDPTIALRRIIQSQLYPVVIAPNQFEELRVFKAFQLLTEKSNSVLFLMGQRAPSNAWPISLQMEIHRQGESFQIEVLRQKYGNPS
jgi:hypothetical protein